MNALKAIAALAAGVAIVAVCVLVWVAGVALLESLGDDDPEPPQWSAVQILRKLHDQELTDWDRLTLAIALTESHCNPAAEGSAQDVGILQITPIYAREASRLSGTDYSHADARDIDKALAMYEIVQGHYNPDHDQAEAIRRHNPGAGPGYAAEVRRNLQLVERYEAVRAAILSKQ